MHCLYVYHWCQSNIKLTAAVARYPRKLHDMLIQKGVSESTIMANLIITRGDVTDIGSVKLALLYKQRPVNLIVSGFGAKPVFTNPLSPTLDNPTVCQDGIRTILTASRSLEYTSHDRKPTLVAVSTTGLDDQRRDVPYLVMPLYYWALKVPHEDKKIMETLIREEVQKPESERAIQDYAIVRASLLTDGAGYGADKVRVGSEEEPAIGYSIDRNDVGRWMFEKLVKRGGEYSNKVVSITS